MFIKKNMMKLWKDAGINHWIYVKGLPILSDSDKTKPWLGQEILMVQNKPILAKDKAIKLGRSLHDLKINKNESLSSVAPTSTYRNAHQK